MNNLGATDRIPTHSAKLTCNYRTCVAFWQLSELSELQTMSDNKNPLWSRSCLGSSESFEVIGHQLSPLSTPPLFIEMKESSDFFCNWCVSLEDHFSNLYCKRRANRMCFTHWEERGMSWEELGMSCCSIPHGDIQVREAFCLTRTLKCQLPSPPICLHVVQWLYQRLRIRSLSLQITWKAGTWCKFV